MLHLLDRFFRARRFISLLPIVIALVSLFLLSSQITQAQPRVVNRPDPVVCPPVNSTNDSGLGTLRGAIACVLSGGTVTFDSSLAGQTILLTSTEIVVATADITIDGAGAPGISVSGNSARRIFTSTGTIGSLTLRNITLTHGVAVTATGSDGGALYVRGALMLSNTTLISNSATGSGGGAYITSTLSLTNAQFLSNTASNSGGGAYAAGTTTMNGGLFQGNAAGAGGGGGLYEHLHLDLTDTQFIHNTTTGNGGAANFYSGPANLHGGLFQGNTAGSIGGAMLVEFGINLSGTRVLSNTAGTAGGFFSGGWTSTFTGGLFQGNTSTANNGGGFYEFGGGFALNGTRFIGNAAQQGGGIYQTNGSTIYNANVINALFARNTATTNVGAALYLNSVGNSKILHTTIASATLGGGSAVYVTGGTLGVTDTIVTSYSIGISHTNSSAFENYNLFFNTPISATGAYSIGSGLNDVFGDPKFIDPASDNYHIGTGSAAINAGANAGVTTDFEGDARPLSGGYDIGFDEVLLPCTIVLNTNNSGVGSLRDAVACAPSGGTVTFDSSLAGQTIVLTTSEIVVTQTNITINGSGAPGVKVDGNHNFHRVFGMAAPGSIISLTIQNGSLIGGGLGGGLSTLYPLTLTNVIFISNSADYGGALYATSSLWLSGTQFISNSALTLGGGVYVSNPAVLINTTFVSNTALASGGGLYAFDIATLSNATFINNTANDGGGMYANSVALFSGGLFQGNTVTTTSADGGGGLKTNSTLVLTGTQFLSNTAPGGGGGGMFAGGATTLNGGLFANNSSYFSGGGLRVDGSVWLTGTQFISNTSIGTDAGGMVTFGEATLNGGKFINNTARGGGAGGLYANTTLWMTDTQFISNTASYYGGGLYAGSVATIIGGLFQNNRAQTFGGGLDASQSLALTGTQFLGNHAAQGGGLYQFGSGSVRLINAVFARNVASSSLGAGLWLGSTGIVQILYSTIASPTLGSGSVIYIQTGTVGITDTIISNYSIGISRTHGTVFENDNLFFGNTSNKSGTISGGTHDVIGNPNFVAPASDNYHLKIGAAIGHAIDIGVNADLDGHPRPGVGGFDIGAYQYSGALLHLYLPLTLKSF